MNNLLMNTLSQSSFIILNKKLVQHFKSLEVACVVSYIIDKWRYFDGNDFYYTIEDIVADTFLSERSVRVIIKRLINDEILIDKGLSGVPPKRYFNINTNALINILDNATNLAKVQGLNPCKNETLNPCKSARDKTAKSARDIYNNSIYNNLSNNNKESNNKENNNKSEKIKKSRISIFSQALELYQPNQHFSSDDWAEWVEYKNARCKNLTLQTFKQNFNFLIKLGSSAKASISQSINHNWQGLFEVKQNQQQSQKGYFNGLSAKEQFGSVADGSYNPDDYDFSKLPIYS